MTATMLVLEPIFEADLPPEIYAYRAGRNAQQAVVGFFDGAVQPHLDQMQHASINDPTRHRL